MIDNDRVHLRARHGFSLVEILAVIAVIAVLIALLLTALSAVRRQGDLTQTMSNLRQVGQWLNQYGTENRDHIVPSQFDYSPGANPGISYSGKVRSLPPGDALYGQVNQGTWTDIIWATYELGAFPAAATAFSGNDYRYDSPDRPLYDLLDGDIANPLRAGALNRYDAINGDVMSPYGAGALERGYPGFFAANDFFNARPDAPVDADGNAPPPAAAGTPSARSSSPTRRSMRSIPTWARSSRPSPSRTTPRPTPTATAGRTHLKSISATAGRRRSCSSTSTSRPKASGRTSMNSSRTAASACAT